MPELHINDKSLYDTVTHLCSLCNIITEDIVICDEKSVGEYTHSTDGGVFVLYQSSSYLRSALHRKLLSAYGERYRTMPLPLDYGAFCNSLTSLALSLGSSSGSAPQKEEPAPIIEDGCTLILGNTTVHLTEREMKLYACLRESSGTAVSREELRERVGENTADEGTNVVDVYISYLRRKLAPLLGEGAIISVRGQGYMIPPPRE